MKKLSRNAALAGAALLALLLIPTIATAQEIPDIQSNGNLHLRGYGSGFITGAEPGERPAHLYPMTDAF